MLRINRFRTSLSRPRARSLRQLVTARPLVTALLGPVVASSVAAALAFALGSSDAAAPAPSSSRGVGLSPRTAPATTAGPAAGAPTATPSRHLPERLPSSSPTATPGDGPVRLTCPAPAPDDEVIVAQTNVAMRELGGAVTVIPTGSRVTLLAADSHLLEVACGRYHVGVVYAKDPTTGRDTFRPEHIG